MDVRLRFAPGARLTIRDEDRVVRRVDLSDDGGCALTCDGLSELVRGTSTIFLDRLEDDIQVHDPANTELFQDGSANSFASLVWLLDSTAVSEPDDYTVPGGPVQRTFECQAPFIRPDREESYRAARAFFDREHRSMTPPSES